MAMQDQAPGVVATAAAIEAWAYEARSGDRFAYASRAFLPAISEVAAMARDLAKRGLVYLTQRRSGMIAGEFVYTATRSSKVWSWRPMEAPKPILAPRVNRAAEAADYPAGDLILPLLERAAQFGRPCPTDKQIASRIGDGFAVERVQPGIDALRAAHVIVVHLCSAPTLRLVTIVATGARTGYAKTDKAA